MRQGAVAAFAPGASINARTNPDLRSTTLTDFSSCQMISMIDLFERADFHRAVAE